jgi:hypothetical protein
MNDNRVLYVEEAITGAVKRFLVGWVNEILAETEFVIPLVEFGNYRGDFTDMSDDYSLYV